MTVGSINPKAAITEPIIDELTQKCGVDLEVLRLDRVHPEISGNKWFKLKYNVQEALTTGHSVLLTFGGAFSNHIAAVAALAKETGLDSVGVIRGERVTNPTLEKAGKYGMQLRFVSREIYRTKTDPGFIAGLREKHGSFYLIPEGGTNQLAIRGTEEIGSLFPPNYDYVCVPIGTGGTMAGLVNFSENHGYQALGFSSLKGNFTGRMVADLLKHKVPPYKIFKEYHFGGFAKVKPELINFINRLYSSHGLVTEPIYTGKMFYGIFDLIKQGAFPFGSRILAIHTGGLQGLPGMQKRHPGLLPGIW